MLNFYFCRNKNAILQKPVKKIETVMKKSESACIIGSQNQVKREANKSVNSFDKKNLSKS